MFQSLHKRKSFKNPTRVNPLMLLTAVTNITSVYSFLRFCFLKLIFTVSDVFEFLQCKSTHSPFIWWVSSHLSGGDLEEVHAHRLYEKDQAQRERKEA